MKKKKLGLNIILIVSVLLVSLVFYGYQRSKEAKGSVAIVDFSNSDTIYEISLDEAGLYTISNGEFPVYLEVVDNAIHFVDSQCPDHLCEDFGLISNINSYAVCMPAGVAVIIE